jgi:hypothetical protein
MTVRKRPFLSAINARLSLEQSLLYGGATSFSREQSGVKETLKYVG